MKNNVTLLFYIYKNRLRKITYGDSGPFYFLCFIYMVSTCQAIFYQGVYLKYLLISMDFFQNTLLLQRKDFLFLKKQLNSTIAYFLVFLDLIIFNLIILSLLLFKNLFSYFFLAIMLIFSMPLLLFLKKINYYFKLPFSLIDPLWINYIRKKPWMILILIGTYSVQYISLEHTNIGLFDVSSFGIIYFISLIYTDKERLIYLKFSKIKIQNYLLKSIKSNVLNVIYLSIPSSILLIAYKVSPFEFLFQMFFSMSSVFWIRYLFYTNKIIQGIIYLIIIVLFIYLQKETTMIYYFFSVLFINIMLYSMTIKKLQQIINSYKN
jgi:hypothetical protein